MSEFSEVASGQSKADGENGGPSPIRNLMEAASLATGVQDSQNPKHTRVAEKATCKMHKFSLYETASRFYLVGADIMDLTFRILKIDRTAESGNLNVAEDDIVYSKQNKDELLNAVDDGNRSSGGLRLRCSTWGLLGFIRFTGEYYMLLVIKRSQVAIIGGHYVYQTDGTELVPLTSSSNRSKIDRHTEEARFVSILNNLDLSRSFYFSYSYDITNTLQRNIQFEREAIMEEQPSPLRKRLNEMFIWNHHLLQPASKILKNTYDWCLPIIHGFVDQASAGLRPLIEDFS